MTNLYDINYVASASTSGCYASPMVGSTVTTRGYISALRSTGFYIQTSPTSAVWTGIWVYFQSSQRALLSSVAVGNEVQVTGDVLEYYGLSEIEFGASSTLVVLSTAPVTWVPLTVAPNQIGITCDSVSQEAYEGVLVRINSVTITSSTLVPAPLYSVECYDLPCSPLAPLLAEPDWVSTPRDVVVSRVRRWQFQTRMVRSTFPMPRGIPCSSTIPCSTYGTGSRESAHPIRPSTVST